MLNIYFGNMKGAVYNTSVYFDNTYLDTWLEDEFIRKIIKSVDKADVISNKAIDSKALGVIPVTKLSGGTKTLILVYKDHSKVFNASTCGDNCAKWLLKIAKESKEDITINLHHIMDFGDKPFEIRVLNNNIVTHDMSELADFACEYIYGEELA